MIASEPKPSDAPGKAALHHPSFWEGDETQQERVHPHSLRCLLARAFANHRTTAENPQSQSSGYALQSTWPRARKPGNQPRIYAYPLSSQLLQTDLTALTSAEDEEFYYNTIWYGQKEDGSINTEPATRMVIDYLLRTHVPGIDEYITSLEDYSLPKRLGIQVDDEGLVTIDRNMELRRHALILPSQQTMIYPHQFLRRFYSANFVNMLSKLEQCQQNGMKVKLRIDPLRVTHPQYYTEFIEEDYWYGKKFSTSLLQSKDPK